MIPGTATRTPKHNIQRKPALRNDFAFALPAAKQTLGNTADLASRAQKAKKQKRRYELQAAARAILPKFHRIQSCHRRAAHGATYATIESNGDRARLANVHTCDCGYACPVCAPKIAMKHATELAAAVTAAYKKGWTVIHVTYTLSHHKGESLEKVLSSLADARRKYFLAGRGFQTISQKIGLEGSARALEVTTGDNGWHPHFHELMFLSAGVYDGLEADLTQRWIASLAKLGATASEDHALRIEEGSQHISEYLNKFGRLPEDGGHSVEMELSHGYSKVARKEGKTPFALLTAAADGDEHAGALFSWQSLKKISNLSLFPAVLMAATAGFEVLVELLDDYDLVPDHDIPKLFVPRSFIDVAYNRRV
jgi:plasmid rolling circle replication initiator protein Rep